MKIRKTRQTRTPPSRPPHPWTLFEKRLLVKLREDGVAWDEVARRCGHPEFSCRTQLSFMRRHEKRVEQQHKPISKRPAFNGWVPEPLHFTKDSTGKIRHTSTLIIDAELRARIEAGGITAGLLGDPLPGRSALDKKLQPGAGGLSAPIAAPCPQVIGPQRPRQDVPSGAGHPFPEVSAPPGRQTVLQNPQQPSSTGGPGGVLALEGRT